MDYQDLVETAFQMIVNAGDARTSVKSALDAAMGGDSAAASLKMGEARGFIEEAHRLQTGAVQQEAAGERLEYSMLFTHAQDTLMTIYSEYHLAQKMIAMYDALSAKIAELQEVCRASSQEHRA